MIANMSKNAIIEIHDNIVGESGEETDILSRNELNTIIRNHRKARTLYRKAAILLHDIPRAQPFSEGNKRTGYASTMIFLKFNGKSLRLRKSRIERIIIYSVNNNLTLGEVEKILKRSVV